MQIAGRDGGHRGKEGAHNDGVHNDGVRSGKHVAIIGAGIIGTAIAHAALDAGYKVTLIDPAPPGGEQAASYGNGAFISPASIIPMSSPGLWRQVPELLLNPLGPLTIRWQSLPQLAPWLIRFLLAGATKARVGRTAGLLNALLQDAPARHQALASQIGQPDLIGQEGLVYAYPDRAAFEREALAWELRRKNGLHWQELQGEALRRAEPGLSTHYQFAAVVTAGAHCLDPGLYVAALAEQAGMRGAKLVQARAESFRMQDGQLRAVVTNQGEIICDQAVIAAGIRAASLARMVGDRVPLVSERGYHIRLPGAIGGPVRPVMPSDGKMANSPLPGGLRASGQVELAQIEAAPDWRRADILLQNLRQAWPDLQFDPSKMARWMGHRPSTPDGLPVIGPARRCHGVFHAFGHGHIGLAAAPMTAAIVTAMMLDAVPPVAVAAYSAKRFGRL